MTRSGRRPGAPLVGRDAEVRELVAALLAAREGDGSTLLVEGPPGIGKSRLAAAGAEVAQRSGFTVLRARGSELERQFPFGVARQLLARTTEGAGAEELLGGAAGLARTVLAPAPDAAPPAAAHAVLHGLYWLVANLAERGPLLLVVDDLHWADAESLALVAFLAARTEGVRVLLVLTARDEAPPVVGALAQDPGTRVLVLGPLDPAASARLVAAALAGPVPAALARTCHQATGGNAFLLGELAAELRRGSGAATDPATVRHLAPRAIVRAVLARLDRLPPAARPLAEAVTVLGDGVELRQAAALAGADAAGCGTLADALAAEGVLAEGRPLALAHPLLRAAVAGAMAPSALAALHARAARLLAAEAAGPEVVAAQLLRTEPGDDAWTVAALRAAAGAAMARAAPASAVDYLRRALRERADGEGRAELLLELGIAGESAGDPGGLAALREAAALARTPGLRVRVASVLVPALGNAGRNAEAADVLNAAMVLGDAARAALRPLRLVLSLASVEGRRTTVDEAEGAVRVAEDRRGHAPRLVLAAAAHQLAVADGTAARATAVADLAIADGALLAEFPGDSPLGFFAIGAFYLTSRFALAERLTDEALADARARGAPGAAAHLLMGRAVMRMHQGDLAGADADAHEGLRLTGSRRTFLTPAAVGALVHVALAQGRVDDAERAAGLLSAGLQEPGSVLFQPWRVACAELRLAQGRPRDALGHLDAIAAWERGWGARNGVWCAWRPRAARAHLALGDPARARALAAAGLADARRFGGAHPLGVALWARADVAPEERVALLDEAAAHLRGADARLLLADVLTALGHARLEDPGAAAGAREVLDEALGLAQRLGATAIERSARAGLVRAGGRPRRASVAGSAALTPAERQTVELARRGLSNREIAQAQFVTAKTVETHLSSAYRKLGIHSRAQLADALGR